jgi:Domain of unknown function (DUF4832)/Domain of unknown function (DUF4874)
MAANRLKIASILMLTVVSLTACGGGGSSAVSPTNTAATPTTVPEPMPSPAPAPVAAIAATANPLPANPVVTPPPPPAPATPPATAPPASTPPPAPSPGPAPAPASAQVSATFSGTNADFSNPERGFYGWSGNDFVTQYDAGSVQATYNAGHRLLFAKVELDAFRNADFPDTWLTSLNSSFTKVRAAGMKVTLLFSYDFSAGGQDASAAQIKRHTEQLKPVLAANADLIPYMRAGFVGAWGEWHSSQAGNSCGYNALPSTTCAEADANRVIIRDALLANMPATTQIGFRYPPDLQKWYPSATQQSRAGIHNDCFLAGPSDSGTFDDPTSRPYAKALTNQTAYGGETCENAGTPVRNTCADILSEGAQYHLAWLNINYAPSVLNKWKADGCFEQVSRSMGYRLQLDAVSHAQQATAGDTVAVAVDLRNVGWARIFSDRKLVVTLKHATTGATIIASAGNLQTLPPQATATTRQVINVTLPVGAAKGDYDLYLSAPDIFSATAADGRFAVRFANADDSAKAQAWDSASASFKAGTKLTVK